MAGSEGGGLRRAEKEISTVTQYDSVNTNSVINNVNNYMKVIALSNDEKYI